MQSHACSKQWQISVSSDVERLYQCIGQFIGQILSPALQKLVLIRADALLLLIHARDLRFPFSHNLSLLFQADTMIRGMNDIRGRFWTPAFLLERIDFGFDFGSPFPYRSLWPCFCLSNGAFGLSERLPASVA